MLRWLTAQNPPLNVVFALCRLIRGGGEIMEEIVSKQKHKEINKVTIEKVFCRCTSQRHSGPLQTHCRKSHVINNQREKNRYSFHPQWVTGRTLITYMRFRITCGIGTKLCFLHVFWIHEPLDNSWIALWWTIKAFWLDLDFASASDSLFTIFCNKESPEKLLKKWQYWHTSTSRVRGMHLSAPTKQHTPARAHTCAWIHTPSFINFYLNWKDAWVSED